MAFCRFLRIEVQEKEGSRLAVLAVRTKRINAYRKNGDRVGDSFCTRGNRICASCTGGDGNCSEYSALSEREVTELNK